MRIIATVTKGEFIQGNEYDLPANKATAMLVAGTAKPVTVAFSQEKEHALKPKYETR